ncbi:BTAD domain-containing putative transcriptional regulator [Dactylosporangium sp. CS-047395]|uniref:BTAD domain-containing putative transcriptional regulator n=1 Tax=Dactylosporangium sp. CS-047395 TaxID=3239936 RepID=UPI003D916069
MVGDVVKANRVVGGDRRTRRVEPWRSGRTRWHRLLLLDRVAAALRTCTALICSVAGLGVLPVILWWLQSVLWAATDWRAVLAEPMSLITVLFAVVSGGWGIWLWLVIGTAHDVAAMLRRQPLRRRLPASLSGLAGGVAGMIAVLGQPTSAAAGTPPAMPSVVAGPDPSIGVSPFPAEPTAMTAVTAEPASAATLTSGQTVRSPAVIYEVRRGDWLGSISNRFLGDFDRYPEVQRLNPELIRDGSGRHGPNHIEAGWRLVLPADAQDRGPERHATGASINVDGDITNDGDTADSVDGDEPADPAPGASPPSPAAEIQPTGTSSSPTGIASDPAATPASPAAPTPVTQQRQIGILSSKGWIGVPIVAVVVAGLLWLRRQHPASGAADLDESAGSERRHDMRPEPRPTGLAGDGRSERDQAMHPTEDEQEASGNPDSDAVHATSWPPGDTCALTGPGAHDAARGMLVATLTATQPAPDAGDYDQVIVPAETLAALFPGHTDRAATLPRLHVTASLPEALTVLETLLLRRRRREQECEPAQPDEPDTPASGPHHPRALLLTHPPQASADPRMRAVLGLGAPLRITAAVLGPWSGATPWDAHGDGRSSRPGRHPVMIDQASPLRLLTGSSPLGTADGGPAEDVVAAPAAPAPQPPATSGGPGLTPDPPAARVAEDAAAPEPPDVRMRSEAAQPSMNGAGTTRPATAAAVDLSGPALVLPVQVRVLGEPVVLDAGGHPVAGMRQHARELMVYLAVHRDGAALTDIMEILWPAATLSRAGQRLSTDTADLRRRIREAAGQLRRSPGHGPTAGKPTIEPVVNMGSRYHLNPDVVDVDLWRLDDALGAAAAATDPAERLRHLRAAVGIPPEPLAADRPYDWIDLHREHARRQHIRGRVRLAALLGEADPPAAAELLQAAADLDPLHEELARRALRGLAAIGDITAIANRLERLRAALATIGEQPGAETLTLVAELRRTTGIRQPSSNQHRAAPSRTSRTGADR